MQREFVSEELTNDFLEKLKNRPILFEHAGDPIGYITDAHLTNGGALMIEGKVEASQATVDGMKTGAFHALSLAHEYKMYKKGNSFVVSKEPLEVSICAEGAREGCWLSILDDNNETGQVRMSKQTERGSESSAPCFIGTIKMSTTVTNDQPEPVIPMEVEQTETATEPVVTEKKEETVVATPLAEDLIQKATIESVPTEENVTALNDVRNVLKEAQSKMQDQQTNMKLQEEKYQELQRKNEELEQFKQTQMEEAKHKMENDLLVAQKGLNTEIAAFRKEILGDSTTPTTEVVTEGSHAASILTVVPQHNNVQDISKQRADLKQVTQHINQKTNTIKQQQDEIDRLKTLVEGSAIVGNNSGITNTTTTMNSKKRPSDQTEEQEPPQRIRTAAAGKIGHMTPEDGFFLNESGKICASAGICPVAAQAAAGKFNFREWSKQTLGTWKTRMKNQDAVLRKHHMISDTTEEGVVKASAGASSSPAFNLHNMANYIHNSTNKESAAMISNAKQGAGLGPGLADFNPKLWNELLEYSSTMKTMDGSNPAVQLIHNQYYEVVNANRQAR
jgi:hypothetical protein